MPRKRSKIEKSLSCKGFQLEETHHRLYRFYDGDKFTGVKTFISTGSKYKDYDDNLISKLAKQLKLTKKETLELIDCPMDESRYRTILKDKGILQ